MASQGDAGFFAMSPARTISSPSLLRSVSQSTSKTLRSPLPKPNLHTTSSPSVSGEAPSSPASPSKLKTRGDRYIPDRTSSSAFTVSQFALSHADSPSSERYPGEDVYKRSLARSMFDREAGELLAPNPSEPSASTVSESFTPSRGDSVLNVKGVMSTGRLNSPKSPSKMLSFSPRVSSGANYGSSSSAAPPHPHYSPAKVLFAQMQSPRRKTTVRVIPTTPERVLDAPGLIDDYYLNLLDWSSTNLVAVALGDSVFVWNAFTGESRKLFSLDDDGSDPGCYVASLAFSGNGQYLAVGTDDRLVKIWDIQAERMVRSVPGHLGRIVSLSWNDQLLSSGARDSLINTHDVRLANSRIFTFEGHTNEVCGLKWSPDGTQLASGSNDNALNVWTLASPSPLFKFDQHNAAVKAISWCPWQRNLLASGGGTADKTIKLWNTSTGSCLHSVDTKSQVCSLQWSKNVKELVSSHGFSQNQLSIWKYPSMTKQAELTGHGNRVLHTAISPDGTTIVSAAADETLRFWRVFEVESALPKLPKSHSEANLRKKMLR